MSMEKCTDMIDYLNTSAEKWLNGVEADDDVTFVAIKVK